MESVSDSTSEEPVVLGRPITSSRPPLHDEEGGGECVGGLFPTGECALSAPKRKLCAEPSGDEESGKKSSED